MLLFNFYVKRGAIITQREYAKAYKTAQSASVKLLNSTRNELLTVFQEAGDLAAQAVIDAQAAGFSDLTSSAWSTINQQLQAGADLVSQATEELTPALVSEAYGNFAAVDEDALMDAVSLAGKSDVITAAGVRSLTAAVNIELLAATANRVYTDGYTFSERIWKTFDLSGAPIGVNGDYQYRIKNLILTGQAQGRDAVDIAKDIQVYITDGKSAVFTAGRYGQLIPGTGEYKNRISGTVDWRALRLARSELYASLQMGQIADGLLNPGSDGYDWVKNAGNPIDPDGSRNASGRRCIDIANGSPYTYDQIQSFGYQHPNCYAEGTEVYTSDGWKDFKDVSLKEHFLSVNPETLEYEWVNAIAKQDFYFEGEAIQFKHKWLELITTPGHNNFVGTHKGGWSFKTSQELYNNPCSKKYPRYFDKWVGDTPAELSLGDYLIPAKDYCEFMGYFLSEGCVTRHSGGNHTFFGSISQIKEQNLGTIGSLLDRMPFYCGKQAKGWYFYDQSVCLHLSQFGKSWEKYIPENIMRLDKDLINTFLDAFILGDGHIRPERVSVSGIKSNKSTVLTTSSERMASQIGELLIKVGGYPSFFYQKPKWVNHKNGRYLTKHPAIIVSWNKSKSATIGSSLKVSKIDYSGRMYDVTLEKNHILWVRYKGKTCFSGNCMCYIRQNLMNQSDFIAELKSWEPGTGNNARLDAWMRTVYSA